MARGSPGAFGGTAINNPWVWGAFCLVFLVGLGDWRRPFSLRNLDLLFLLSPTASLWYFNHGDVFTAVPLFYPLLDLGGAARDVDRRPQPRHAGRAALAGLGAARRHDLPRRLPRRAQRRALERDRRRLLGRDRRRADRQGNRRRGGTSRSRRRPRTASRSRPAARRTPPARSATGSRRTGAARARTPKATRTARSRTSRTSPATRSWAGAGSGTTCPAAHFTSIAFDLLTLLGLFLVGLRFGGQRLGAVLAFAWAAYPFTQYVSNSNTNDAIMPCFLVWGFWLVSRPAARGVLAALSGWTKFASLLVVPLWLTYPGRRPSWRFALGFAAATLAVFSILLLSRPTRSTRRTSSGRGRSASRSGARRRGRSGTGASTTHAGSPTSTSCSTSCRRCSIAGAVVVAFFPRRKSPLQLAAFTAVLLAGFELVVTYWLYTYIPWFYPFAALALLAPAVPLRKLVDAVRRGRGRARSPRRARRRCT